jgi:hypothetical protein
MFTLTMARPSLLATLALSACFSKPAPPAGPDGAIAGDGRPAGDGMPMGCAAGTTPLIGTTQLTLRVGTFAALDQDVYDDLLLPAILDDGTGAILIYYGAQAKHLDLPCPDVVLTRGAGYFVGGIDVVSYGVSSQLVVAWNDPQNHPVLGVQPYFRGGGGTTWKDIPFGPGVVRRWDQPGTEPAQIANVNGTEVALIGTQLLAIDPTNPISTAPVALALKGTVRAISPLGVLGPSKLMILTTDYVYLDDLAVGPFMQLAARAGTTIAAPYPRSAPLAAAVRGVVSGGSGTQLEFVNPDGTSGNPIATAPASMPQVTALVTLPRLVAWLQSGAMSALGIAIDGQLPTTRLVTTGQFLVGGQFNGAPAFYVLPPRVDAATPPPPCFQVMGAAGSESITGC